MALIFGITESLKSLKSELNYNGIHRFNSVKEIKDFLSNYNSEKHTILKNESDKLDGEYSNISSNLKSERMIFNENCNLLSYVPVLS